MAIGHGSFFWTGDDLQPGDASCHQEQAAPSEHPLTGAPACRGKPHSSCGLLTRDRGLDFLFREHAIPNADLRIAFQHACFDAAGLEVIVPSAAIKSFAGNSRIRSSASAIFPTLQAFSAVFSAAFSVAPAWCSCLKIRLHQFGRGARAAERSKILPRLREAGAVSGDRAVIFEAQKQIVLRLRADLRKKQARQIRRAVDLLETPLSAPD